MRASRTCIALVYGILLATAAMAKSPSGLSGGLYPPNRATAQTCQSSFGAAFRPAGWSDIGNYLSLPPDQVLPLGSGEYVTQGGPAEYSQERWYSVTREVDPYGEGVQTIPPYGYFPETDIIGTVTAGVVHDAHAIVHSAGQGAKSLAYASVVDNRSGDPIAVTSPVVGSGPIYVPGAAALSGAAGTDWKTDLEVHNPGTTQASYSIALLKRDQANPTPTTKSFNLGPGQSVRYANVLQSMFGFSGAATLRITPTSGQVVASARTYNDQPQGTYGQFIAGAPESTAIAYGQEGRLVQLAQSSSDASGFRTNIGVINVIGSTLTVEAGLYRGDGTLLGTKSFSLPAYGYQQADRIFRSVIGADVADGFAVLSTPTTNGKFFAYASVVDNRSGDPIAVMSPVVGSGPIYVPGAAALSGAAGTDWKTDLEVHNPGTPRPATRLRCSSVTRRTQRRLQRASASAPARASDTPTCCSRCSVFPGRRR